MGLDMYLTASKFISSYDKNKPFLKKLKSAFPKMKSFKLESVRFNVGYWRKANHIHKWFVDNIEGGEDNNCKEFSVSEEELKTLLNLCKEVQKNKKKAEELLPTQAGFFFGGTEYDEYYFKDIEDTITIIEKILKEVNFEEYDIEYCASCVYRN